MTSDDESSMADDYIRIDMEKSDYSKIIFIDICDSYVYDLDLTCKYILPKIVVPEYGDRVAIYKVGWSTPTDYLNYNWATVPPHHEADDELYCVFKGSQLPRDTDNYYQFCYISEKGRVRGQSAPFQFKQPENVDYVMIDDGASLSDTGVDSDSKLCENDSVVVVKSRASVLSEQITQLQQKNMRLAESNQYLDKQLLKQREYTVSLEQKLKDCESEIGFVKSKLGEIDLKQMPDVGALVHSVEEWRAEIGTLKADLEHNAAYILELQDAITHYNDEKEELCVKLEVHQTDREGFQKHIKELSHELQLSKVMSEQAVALEKEVAQLKTEIDQWKEELLEEKGKHLQLQEIISAQEDERLKIFRQLVDTEDMLQAMKESKALASNEVIKFNEIKDKMAADYAIAEEHLKRIQVEMSVMALNLQQHKGRETVLTNEHHDMKNQLDKMKLICEQLEKEKDETSSQSAVVRELHERLEQGAKEYQTKFLECHKLRKKIKKLKQKMTDSEKTSADQLSIEDISLPTNHKEVDLDTDGPSSSDSEAQLPRPHPRLERKRCDGSSSTETGTNENEDGVGTPIFLKSINGEKYYTRNPVHVADRNWMPVRSADLFSRDAVHGRVLSRPTPDNFDSLVQKNIDMIKAPTREPSDGHKNTPFTGLSGSSKPLVPVRTADARWAEIIGASSSFNNPECVAPAQDQAPLSFPSPSTPTASAPLFASQTDEEEPSVPVECPICGQWLEVTDSMVFVDSHVEGHNQAAMIQLCEECTDSLPSKVTCPVCSLILDTTGGGGRGVVENHYQVAHKYKCPVCAIFFANNSYRLFERHVQTHFDK